MKTKKAGAVSEAQKLRDKLSNMNKQRTEFENKTKELETHMVVGFDNLEKIEKGIKSNDLKQAEALEVGGEIFQTSSSSSPAKSPSRQSSPMKRRLKASTDGSTTPVKESGGVAPMLDGIRVVETYVMPPGLRVSDWCFLGAHDSTPPVVKANDIYENIRLLGRGSFGDVYLVKNREDNRMFANKTIFCEKEKYMEETLREVQFMRKNRHPCIIDIHDGFITAQPRILNIVMSYCEAGDLGKVVSAARKGKTNISETQIVKWSMQIALAIHFLHENGVIHRDLKPVNVMLTEGGDLVKVADFGLAMDVMQHSGKKGGAEGGYHEAGTPYYTAPEMIQGLAYNYPVDCFAFGVMLHELMRLDLPFQGSSTGDLVRSILQDDPPALPSQYSDELKNITLLLLEKDPSKRMGFAGMLSHPLLNTKMLQFQTSYKPKALDERIRRVFLKQLNVQIEGLATSKKSSLESYSKLWEDHTEAVAAKQRSEEEAKIAAALAAEEALVAMTNKAMSRASSRKQVKPRSGSQGGSTAVGGDALSVNEQHHHDDDEEDDEHHRDSKQQHAAADSTAGIANIDNHNTNTNDIDIDADGNDDEALVTAFNDNDLFELSASASYHQQQQSSGGTATADSAMLLDGDDSLMMIPVTGGRNDLITTINTHNTAATAASGGDDSNNDNNNNNDDGEMDSWEASSSRNNNGNASSSSNGNAGITTSTAAIIEDESVITTIPIPSSSSSSPTATAADTIKPLPQQQLPIVEYILSSSKLNNNNGPHYQSSSSSSTSSKRTMFVLPDIHAGNGSSSNQNSARNKNDKNDDEGDNNGHHESEIPALPKI